MRPTVQGDSPQGKSHPVQYTIMNQQTILLEALANAITRPRPRMQSMNEKLTEFLRTKPPTFGGSTNPLDADDWLRVIQRKIDPFHCEDGDKVLLPLISLRGLP